MKNRLIWIVCLICGLSSLQAQQNVPYKNPLLPTEVRVNDLLAYDVEGKDCTNLSFTFVGCIRWSAIEQEKTGSDVCTWRLWFF